MSITDTPRDPYGDTRYDLIDLAGKDVRLTVDEYGTVRLTTDERLGAIIGDAVFREDEAGDPIVCTIRPLDGVEFCFAITAGTGLDRYLDAASGSSHAAGVREP